MHVSLLLNTHANKCNNLIYVHGTNKVDHKTNNQSVVQRYLQPALFKFSKAFFGKIIYCQYKRIQCIFLFMHIFKTCLRFKIVQNS